MAAKEDTKRVFLIDGSNYLYRAFYAIKELSNSKGFPTNAIYGFTSMLMKLLRDWQPAYIAVVFDLRGPTVRHETYDQYKANRKPAPDGLVMQIPHVKDVIRAFSIPVVEMQGVEADDIIGTLARKYSSQGAKVVIVSGDKDLMQLVSDEIIMLDTMKEKTYDSQAVRERFGVPPEKVAEILGLMGDSSDNIPGVPGIGAKGAQSLVEEYGSVEEVIKNVERIKNAKAKKAIREHADQARMSRDLALIRTNISIDVSMEECRLQKPDTGALAAIFREFEFSSLIHDLKITEPVEAVCHAIHKAEELDDLLEKIKDAPELTIDLLLNDPCPMSASIVGIGISMPRGETFYIPLSHDYAGLREQLKIDNVLNRLAPFLSDGRIAKYGHDLKSTIVALSRHGIKLKGTECDVMVASYLLNPSRHSFELVDITLEHLNRKILSAREITGTGTRAIPLGYLPVEKMFAYLCGRAEAVSLLAPELMKKAKEGGLDHLFHEIEMPLVSVLASMERQGVLLDASLLQEMSQETQQLLSISEEKIYRLAGEKFNINSPKQLQVILFDKLGLPRGRKTKEGYSTDVEVLSYLAAGHELPAEILSYRSMAKLKSTYIDALPLLVNKETGRIHTTYNQTATATGRLSSSNPNLQNIPVRTLEGKRIRQAFIAPPGRIIVSADYSQIELRVLAHLSDDPALIDAFLSGEDIHNRTASDIFGVFPEMVNTEMRRQAKVINFGVLYGMSAFGLSKELGLNQKMAQAYIDGYFDRYKGVKNYLDKILSEAREKGYVTTLMKRRRFIPELTSNVAAVRQFAERMAVNTPIQGTAADLIKIAMINISRQFKEKGFSSSMIMQVHDELVFEVPETEKDDVMAVVKREMEEAVRLIVPLKVDISSGRNWDEAHS